jgi:hypothetical protein
VEKLPCIARTRVCDQALAECLQDLLRVLRQLALEHEFLSDVGDPREHQVRHHHETRQHYAGAVPSVQRAIVPLDDAVRHFGQWVDGQLRENSIQR